MKVLSVLLLMFVPVSAVSADDTVDARFAELTKRAVAAKSQAIIGVPGYRAAEKIIGKYGTVDRIAVYVDATKVAVSGMVSEHSFDTWSASIRLAAVQQEDNHLRVLIGIANAWHKKGIPNPVAKAMERMTGTNVSGEQLELLYRQVLLEQGIKSIMHEDNPEIWELLE